MAGIDFKKWQSKTILAIVMGLIIIVGVYSVTPIYGLNISPQSTHGTSFVGGSFGELVPTLPAHTSYTSHRLSCPNSAQGAGLIQLDSAPGDNAPLFLEDGTGLAALTSGQRQG